MNINERTIGAAGTGEIGVGAGAGVVLRGSQALVHNGRAVLKVESKKKREEEKAPRRDEYKLAYMGRERVEEAARGAQQQQYAPAAPMPAVARIVSAAVAASPAPLPAAAAAVAIPTVAERFQTMCRTEILFDNYRSIYHAAQYASDSLTCTNMFFRPKLLDKLSPSEEAFFTDYMLSQFTIQVMDVRKNGLYGKFIYRQDAIIQLTNAQLNERMRQAQNEVGARAVQEAMQRWDAVKEDHIRFAIECVLVPQIPSIIAKAKAIGVKNFETLFMYQTNIRTVIEQLSRFLKKIPSFSPAEQRYLKECAVTMSRTRKAPRLSLDQFSPANRESATEFKTSLSGFQSEIYKKNLSGSETDYEMRVLSEFGQAFIFSSCLVQFLQKVPTLSEDDRIFLRQELEWTRVNHCTRQWDYSKFSADKIDVMREFQYFLRDCVPDNNNYVLMVLNALKSGR